MNNKFVLVFLLTIFSLSSYGQLSQGGTPPSFKYASNLRSTQESTRSIPVNLDVDKLNWEDQVAERNGSPLRIAESLAVDIDIQNTGNWTTLSDSTQIWRQTVEAKDAQGLIISYEDFYIPKGAKLYIYNNDKSQILGAYTNETHPTGGRFATELIYGDSFTLEYVASRTSLEEPRLKISDVGYVYSKNVRNQWEPLINSPYENSKGQDVEENCRININCAEGDNWQNQKRGVVLYFIKLNGIWYACSGSLINNTNQDATPYLLSATHCFLGNPDFNSVIAYFNFEFSACENETVTPAYKTLVGVTPLVEIPLSGGSDNFLVKMNNKIPESYQPYFNGWDRRNVAPTSGAIIHHPRMDVKKISIYNVAGKSSQYRGGTNETGAKNAHWQIVYSKSVTEGGSSGSPLFNQDQLIVGTLTGGNSYCDIPSNPDYYGKLWYGWDQASVDSSYDTKLQTYLDPLNKGAETLKGYDPNNSGVIDDAEKEELVLYPNPTNRELHINANSIVRKINIYNLQGRMVFSQSDYSSSTATVSVEHFASGIYMIQVETDNKKISGKFIKK